MTKDSVTNKRNKKQDLFDPIRWGLPQEAIDDLATRLRDIWSRFRKCFTTKTYDTSEYAFVYMRGLLTMDTDRNYANIARRVIDPDDDGQNLQQFISDSPWNERLVFQKIQAEINQEDQLAWGMLTLDESGDKRSGSQSAGTTRQHIGRIGKVDMGQVGVALGYYKDDVWSMVDAELYLPEGWFDESHDKLRKRWHIPQERAFASKTQLGLDMIRRAKANGMRFQVVGCDTTYGRDSEFRAKLEDENILYMADIPENIHVYTQRPVFGIPADTKGKRGRPHSRMQVINGVQSLPVSSLANEMILTPVFIRYSERGELTYECAAQRVWTATPDCIVRKEWLLVRRETDGDLSFSLSDAPEDTTLARLAFWRCQRYFAERVFQDSKTEAGWDELEACKYRAWMHHTALDALALWFMAKTKFDWARQYTRDPDLLYELELMVLPGLSMSNIREMLKSVLPLKRLSPEESRRLVVKHLVNRSHSTSSRLKAQQRLQLSEQNHSP